MKIHYFYANHSDVNWYKADLIALLEERFMNRSDKMELSFKYLEQLDINICKADHYHSNRFRHEFSKDSCFGSGYKTRKELYEGLANYCGTHFRPISKMDFLRLRQVIIGLYLKQSPIDFSQFAGKQKYFVRQIL